MNKVFDNQSASWDALHSREYYRAIVFGAKKQTTSNVARGMAGMGALKTHGGKLYSDSEVERQREVAERRGWADDVEKLKNMTERAALEARREERRKLEELRRDYLARARVIGEPPPHEEADSGRVKYKNELQDRLPLLKPESADAPWGKAATVDLPSHCGGWRICHGRSKHGTGALLLSYRGPGERHLGSDTRAQSGARPWLLDGKVQPPPGTDENEAIVVGPNGNRWSVWDMPLSKDFSGQGHADEPKLELMTRATQKAALLSVILADDTLRALANMHMLSMNELAGLIAAGRDSNQIGELLSGGAKACVNAASSATTGKWWMSGEFVREADGSCEWVVEDNAMGPADLVAIGERENVTYRFDDWLIKAHMTGQSTIHNREAHTAKQLWDAHEEIVVLEIEHEAQIHVSPYVLSMKRSVLTLTAAGDVHVHTNRFDTEKSHTHAHSGHMESPCGHHHGDTPKTQVLGLDGPRPGWILGKKGELQLERSAAYTDLEGTVVKSDTRHDVWRNQPATTAEPAEAAPVPRKEAPEGWMADFEAQLQAIDCGE